MNVEKMFMCATRTLRATIRKDLITVPANQDFMKTERRAATVNECVLVLTF